MLNQGIQSFLHPSQIRIVETVTCMGLPGHAEGMLSGMKCGPRSDAVGTGPWCTKQVSSMPDPWRLSALAGRPALFGGCEKTSLNLTGSQAALLYCCSPGHSARGSGWDSVHFTYSVLMGSKHISVITALPFKFLIPYLVRHVYMFKN